MCSSDLDSLFSRSESTRIRFNVTVSGGDLNGDHLTDLVIGQSTGGVLVFYQHNPNIGYAESLPRKPDFDLYPNPTSGKTVLRINATGTGDAGWLSVIDPFGRVISSEQVTPGMRALDSDRWADGIYLVRLQGTRSAVTQKLIVNH